MPENLEVEAQPQPEPRFLFVDAIRGIAALAVVFRHLYFNSALGPPLSRIFPLPIQELSIWGAAGVYAFFVLSGFVIAHSLRNSLLTLPAVGNFILRRQIRLDPPYWVVIALSLAWLPIFRLLSSSHMPKYSVIKVLCNMFYVHNILHVPPIVDVSWTLCIEIQFYLVFIALLAIGRKAPRLSSTINISSLVVGLVFVTGLASLLLKFVTFKPSFFISYWHYFAIGALGYWAMQRAIPLRVFGVFTALFTVATVASPLHKINDQGMPHSLSFTAMLVGLTTILALVYAGRQNLMSVWGRQAIFQYGGKISYSLYLVHHLILFIGFAFYRHLNNPQPVIALLTWAICLALSILAAHFLNLAVERPSMKLASRLKLKDSVPIATPTPLPA